MALAAQQDKKKSHGMSHATRVLESCHTNGWVMAHVRMHHAAETKVISSCLL